MFSASVIELQSAPPWKSTPNRERIFSSMRPRASLTQSSPIQTRPLSRQLVVQTEEELDRWPDLFERDIVGRLRCGDSLDIAASELRARLLVREGGTFYRNVEEKLFYRPGDAR